MYVVLFCHYYYIIKNHLAQGFIYFLNIEKKQLNCIHNLFRSNIKYICDFILYHNIN